ncbi:hypothetical protein PLEOSDRAFT_1086421 [Pleurotus ostreatus PC15]|uniref:CCHC-type domain-containing protein n=1 Tax=Pleurotus ostreatus (strain PC15) TaxID=1137138 RepID=A0A067N8D7_PLEO1|nr:hypothetical protein PLEOSDRAFT_1086421 [Pleurotus ostreatus PC15]
MTGKVLEWTRTRVPDEQVSSFRRICRSLQEAFGDPNPWDTAITALAHLHQGSDMAEDYVMKFNAYKDNTGYNDVALVELFKRGLNAGLLTWIYGRRPLPGRCEEWQEEAIALDRQWREAQAYAKAASAKPAAKTTMALQNQWRPYYQKQTPPQNQQQQQQQPAKPTPPALQIAARDPNAMDVDRSQRGLIHCYKCGGLGHMARDCKRRLDVRQMTYEDQQEYWQEELTRQAVVIRNADGTSNNAGRVTEKVEIRMLFRGHLEVMVLYVTNLGNVDVILELTWLKKHNLEIDWKTEEVVMSRCPRQCLNYQDKLGQHMQAEPYPGEDKSEEDVEEAVAGVRQWNRLRSGYLRELDDLTNQYYESVARMYINRMWKTHMHVETEEEEEMHLRAVGKYDYKN